MKRTPDFPHPDAIRIKTNSGQDGKARKKGDSLWADPGNYRALSNNCADKVQEIIEAALGHRIPVFIEPTMPRHLRKALEMLTYGRFLDK